MDEQIKHEREHDLTFLSTQQSTPEMVNSDSQKQSELTQTATEELRQRAHALLAAGNWPRACEAFLALLAADAHDEEALLGLAEVLDKLNQFETLYDTAKHILEITPNSAPALAYKARALQKMERISQATIANDQALLLDTHLGLAWINRSGLQLIQEKFPEALKSAQHATKLAATDSRAWANYGVALLNFNRLGEALEAFDQSLALDPQQLFALQMKGDILCNIGRMTEVIPLAQAALRLAPQDVRTITMGIKAFRALEMYSELQAWSSQLIQSTPNNPLAWENYMRGLRGLGQFSEANDVLDRLIALDASNVRYLTIKADTLYRLERYREAVSIAERAKRLEPDDAPAIRIYEKSLRLMYQRKEKKKS
ncbi:tetratricopeptide repeat protein [Dictyobacter arantiisoli]|uniref:Uncharacterized protein n=1 Tax=Dictyobacter arantiisoli TaxID=2014874 RepID=A0A5A5TGK3_9CHLR|nr:tetratricopeptide repeat protein [Dictyobacter arantiisoli]GCF10276.1 hypothetical protein KDI_38400 [Dictyobacter arantiisoli]